MPFYYRISPEIFQRFPGYVRGVVVAEGVANRLSPPGLVQLLREAEAGLPAQISLEQVAEHPRIKCWREAYRSFGAKPSEFRSSIEGLARRVLHGDPLPSINALVDIGNLVSLRHLIPAGGHAIDLLNGDLCLRPATGQEQFTAFGSDVLEHPLPGEIIFAEGDIVLTRRWTWRQANHTLTLPETTAIEFNVDGLPPVPLAEIQAAGQEIIDLVGRFCGGRTRFEILSVENAGMLLAA
jgi:DNA/RNA-binding domain of Phe-tRNA-synthetase-like protein